MLSSHCKVYENKIEEIEFSSIFVKAMNIRIIDKLRPCFQFVSQLYIDNNLLLSLNGIGQFYNLEVLSFNFNQVSLFTELYKINNTFFMRSLSFIGNPMEADKRTEKQYLVENIFGNLKELNPVFSRSKGGGESYRSGGERNINHKNHRQDNINLKNHRQDNINQSQKIRDHSRNEEMQKNTERYHNRSIEQKWSQKTERYTDSSSHKQFTRTSKLHHSPASGMAPLKKPRHSSTGINTLDINNNYNISPSIDESAIEIQEQNANQIEIHPFEQANEHSDQDDSLRGTGYFQQNQEHKSLARQFLQQYKMLIASSFRFAHLKQMSFNLLKNYKQLKQKEERDKYIKKAWAAIKMMAVLDQKKNS